MATKKNTQIGSENTVYRFISNHGDYFQPGIFGDDFYSNVAKMQGANESAEKWANLDSEHASMRDCNMSTLKKEYERFVSDVRSHEYMTSDAVQRTHEFNTLVLRDLGYSALTKEGGNEEGYNERFFLHGEKGNTFVPVRHIFKQNGKVKMLVMEMNHQIASGDDVAPGLFEQKYVYDFGKDGKPLSSEHQEYNKTMWQRLFRYKDEDAVIEEEYRIDPNIINEAVTRIFLEPEDSRPQYILLLSGNIIYLLDESRWHQGAYAEIDLDVFFSEWSISTKHKNESCALFDFLLARPYVYYESGEALLAKIQEEGFRNAAGVTAGLKNGVIHVIEKIANEARHYYWDKIDAWNAEDMDFTSKLRDDCLIYVYRLLFILYASSRDEFGIFPAPDGYEKEHFDLTVGTYKKGYSFEMLRDLEQVPLRRESSRNGFFIDESVKLLFKMLDRNSDVNKNSVVFKVSRIDSQLFNDNEFHYLSDLKIRNFVWQEIIQELSLQNSGNGKTKRKSRISYRNLGINQLGSVYESLLSYRLIYADEDLIEVFSPKQSDVTYLTPKSNRSIYKDNEVLRVHDYDSGEDSRGSEHDVIYKKGEFVYRLNGLDRQKSASYYTPEILTRTVVKYTLKNIFERIDRKPNTYTELLELKILEPAMGAGAFLNEVVNQLAVKYLEYEQKATGVRIAPNEYYKKLQNIKYFIASSNVYGVDINPTAVELGKLSLWLNVLGRASGKVEAEVPFFGHHLAEGNATIGAWFKAYKRDEVVGREEEVRTKKSSKMKLVGRAWWEKAPKLIKFGGSVKNFYIKRKSSTQGSARHPTDQVYSFLLPMDGMFGALECKDLAKKYPDETKKMQDLQKDWKAPISNAQFDRLLRISEKIDELLTAYAQKIRSVEEINAKTIKDRENVAKSDIMPGDNFMPGEYENIRKNALVKTARDLDNQGSEFSRLHLVLDYWCALWFADFKDVDLLPTREEYWRDIEHILGMEILEGVVEQSEANELPLWDNSVDSDQDDEDESDGETILTPEQDVYDVDHVGEEEDLGVPYEAYSEKKLHRDADKTNSAIIEINEERLKFIKTKANEQKFFHPMLEFLEVFWRRSGFDVICGNPPWVKYAFDEAAVLSTVAPEIYVKGKTSPQIHKLRNELCKENVSLLHALEKEEVGAADAAGFMNAMCNYPLLQGQQCNLYKCVVENCFDYMSAKGFAGILHPTSLLSDAKGQAFRKVLYQRLKDIFIFKNEIKLFADIHHQTEYAVNVYRGQKSVPNFHLIADLFHPATIDDCFNHDGHGKCQGIKDDSGNWNVNGHKDRIIDVNESALLAMSRAFEGSEHWDTTSLISLHSVQAFKILEKFGEVKDRVGRLEANVDYAIPNPLDNTNAVKDGIIAPLPNDETVQVDLDKYQLVLGGPMFHVGNPVFKNGRHKCTLKSDYDPINLNKIDENFVQNTKYLPQIPADELKGMFKGFKIGKDGKGNDIFDSALDYYSVCFRKMLSLASERTLIGAIIPPHISFVNAVFCMYFIEPVKLLDFEGIVSSLVMDYFIKIKGNTGLYGADLQQFPRGLGEVIAKLIRKRVVLLNCLTANYKKLYEETFSTFEIKNDWSLNDSRLKNTSTLGPEWNYNTPLRNAYERRMALVEIDVLVAMAMNFTLDDLLFMYDSQFPVLKQYEDNTWYDAKGNILYTKNSGLVGTGLDSKTFGRDKEKLFKLQPGETYEYIVNNNEMYNGQKDFYYAPFDKCDRVEDYKRAWGHFEKLLAADSE